MKLNQFVYFVSFNFDLHLLGSNKVIRVSICLEAEQYNVFTLANAFISYIKNAFTNVIFSNVSNIYG